jgi:2-octaprenylphenol hydroxylase
MNRVTGIVPETAWLLPRGAPFQNFDVIIVGGGIVGASFALQLRGSGLHLAVIDLKPAPSVPLEGEYDHRVYAITPTNMAWLDRLEVFQPQDRGRFTPIRGMEISAGTKAILNFSARAANRSELAVIIEHRLLAARFHERLSILNHVQLIPQSNPKSLEVGAADVRIGLDDGTELTAGLLVGADGGDSWVRNEAGFAVREKDYDQIALVANFVCERPHGHLARQWFIDQNVLAWLPLGEKTISIVWSVAAEQAQRLIELEPEAFARAVDAAGENILGDMTLVSPVSHFPLRSLRSENMIKPRVALIGDAAHVIHPLAGQGLNLGLQDAQTLAQVIANKAVPESLGDTAVLRRFERTRSEAIATMHGVTDGLQRLFASESGAVAALRNGGLRVTDHMPWLKNALVRRAMG